MYLTRLRLDPRNPHARRDLADAYDMHRTLVRAFVDDNTRVPPRILWRAEPVTNWSDPTVLVQAADHGNWAAVDGISGYLKAPAETKSLSIGNALKIDSRYRFRLFANPTVTRGGKRFGLVTEDAQLTWLSRQGERFGFVVEAVLVTGSDLLKTRKQGMGVSVLKVCFEGRLKVSDTVALLGALQSGIGHGKAFGCGLLSLGHY